MPGCIFIQNTSPWRLVLRKAWHQMPELVDRTWQASPTQRHTSLWFRLGMCKLPRVRVELEVLHIIKPINHIRPPSTTLPKPANSALAPFLLSSSNSLMIPATMILRNFASALAKNSPVPGTHIAGEGIRPMIRV